ncbi:MAG TPA: hypothetical protein VFF79_05250 [Conexibacter sp.]|nr:hypothetical protein [Conexibacter sp.]
MAGVDRSRGGEAAIIGKHVEGRAQAPVGSLVLVYGEDRAPLDGRLVQHCADLYQVMADATLKRLDMGTFPREWLPAVLDAIEQAQPTGSEHDDGRGAYGANSVP